MKKLLILLFALMMMVSLGACASQGGEEKPADEPVVEPVEEAAVPTPEELQGLYHEEIAGRASLEVTADLITIDWANSAFEKTHTELPTSYDAQSGNITYANGVMTTRTYLSFEDFTEREDYNNGTGYFEVNEDRLIWHNDLAEGYDVVIFARNEEVPEESGNEEDMSNPWVFTTDLEEAITVSSIEFDPPQSLPKGFELVTYAANINGIISAEYESKDRRIIVRKSDLYDGQVLSGDYNAYPENWQEVLKGLAIDCYGDGGKINLAYFGTEDLHYMIGCYDKSDAYVAGNGLSIDEIQSMVMGMQ